MRGKTERKEKTVRTRIFQMNLLLVIMALTLFLVIILIGFWLFSEGIEGEMRKALQEGGGPRDVEDLIHLLTMRRMGFILTFSGIGVVCIAALVTVTQLFARYLTRSIMKPLDQLTAGAERIRRNDLSRRIEYRGDAEFESVCGAFNDMQKHILDEQEKNRQYEKARREMISGISHDLRTPLTAVRGTIRGLIDGVADTPEKQRDFLLTADRRAEEMDRLIQQLLDLSRMETGRIPIRLRSLDLRDFLQIYVSERQNDLEEGQELELEDAGKGPLMVQADPDQLLRVMDNLFGNARKYASVHPLQMGVRLRSDDEWAVIRFADNGHGVPPDKLARIFDEFYRVDPSRHQTEGNGLGLYIVRYLLHAMGGDAWAENEEGLAVYLRLPLEGTGNGR